VLCALNLGEPDGETSMAASYNRVILIGNLTRDVEIKYLQSGMAVTEIGLAVNDRRKNQQGEWIDETTFVDVTLWGRTAEVAGEYLAKGSPVYIEGRLKTDSWEQGGQQRTKLKVTGDKIQLIGGKSPAGDDRPKPKPQQQEPAPYPKNDNKRPPNI